MSSISSLSGYANSNRLAGYIYGSNTNTNQATTSQSSGVLQNFEQLRDIQLSSINSLFGDNSNSSSSYQSSNIDNGDVSSILTNNMSAQVSSVLAKLQSSENKNFDKDMETISKSLDSGDLSKAKTAFSTLESKMAKSLTGSDIAGTQKEKDLNALKSALNNGDLQGAKDALGTIKTRTVQARTEDNKNMLNSYQAMANNSYSQGAIALSTFSPSITTVA